jgi:predicted transcriptional regulator of viral defense system
VTIQFAGKGPFKKGILADIKVPTGFIKVSSPETTAWDLVRYSGTAGGMDNVVTVLNEMAERLTPEKLLDTAKRHGDFLVTRRLGFILESLGHKALVEPLIPLVGKEPIRKLDPASPAARAKTDLKWRLAVNLKVEPEA